MHTLLYITLHLLSAAAAAAVAFFFSARIDEHSSYRILYTLKFCMKPHNPSL